MYKATLVLKDGEYTGKGGTALEAITSIPLDWNQIKTKGVLKLAKGKKVAEKLLYLGEARRVLRSKFGAQLWAKNLEYLLR